jgi:hypothetical protein
MFVPGPNAMGGLSLSAKPAPLGPRNWGQAGAAKTVEAAKHQHQRKDATPMQEEFFDIKGRNQGFNWFKGF